MRARRYGVNSKTIRDIWNRATWVKATRPAWLPWEEVPSPRPQAQQARAGPQPALPVRVLASGAAQPLIIYGQRLTIYGRRLTICAGRPAPLAPAAAGAPRRRGNGELMARGGGGGRWTTRSSSSKPA